MAPSNETRPLGAAGPGNCHRRLASDTRAYPPKIRLNQAENVIDAARRQYFFGSHDANRVLFTRGRDIRLDPAQQGDPLNYFVYPYAELDGKPWTGMQSSFSFTDLEPSGASAAAF